MAIEFESEVGRGGGRRSINVRILDSRRARASVHAEKSGVQERGVLHLSGDVVVIVVRGRDLEREDLDVVVGVVYGFGAKEGRVI